MDLFKNEAEKQEEVRFWLAIALIQSGFYDLARSLMRSKIRHPSLLLGLWVQLITTRLVRVIDHESREQLTESEKEILNRLKPHLKALARQMETETRQLAEDARNRVPHSEQKQIELDGPRNAKG